MRVRPNGLTVLRLVLLLVFFSVAGGVRGQGPVQDPLTFNTLPSTCGLANGSITAVANYGSPPYWFYMNGIGPYISNTNTYLFDNLKGDASGATIPFFVSDNGGAGAPVFADAELGDLTPTIAVDFKSTSCLNNDGVITISQDGGLAPYMYSINNGADFSPNGTFTKLASGAPGYDAVVKDASGCISPAHVTIPLDNDFTLSSYDPLPTCEGTPVMLPATSNGDKFTWSPATGLSNPSILNPDATPGTTTTYTLTASRGICPAQTVTTLVTISPAPVPNAGEDQAVCFGQSATIGGTTGLQYRYNWTPSTYLSDASVPSPTVQTPSSTITYSLQLTDGNGCVSLQPDEVTVSVTPPLKVLAGNDTAIYVGQPLQLLAQVPAVNGQLSYEWTPSIGLDNPFIANPVMVLNESQAVTYTVQATTSIGCTGTDTVVVKVFAEKDIFVPNAFTPNNDGHNDLLRPKMPGIQTLHYFSVYSRMGQLLYTTHTLGAGWDGVFNGQAMPAGAYVWIAEGVDVEGKTVVRRGTVVLIR